MIKYQYILVGHIHEVKIMDASSGKPKWREMMIYIECRNLFDTEEEASRFNPEAAFEIEKSKDGERHVVIRIYDGFCKFGESGEYIGRISGGNSYTLHWKDFLSYRAVARNSEDVSAVEDPIGEYIPDATNWDYLFDIKDKPDSWHEFIDDAAHKIEPVIVEENAGPPMTCEEKTALYAKLEAIARKRDGDCLCWPTYFFGDGCKFVDHNFRNVQYRHIAVSRFTNAAGRKMIMILACGGPYYSMEEAKSVPVKLRFAIDPPGDDVCNVNLHVEHGDNSAWEALLDDFLTIKGCDDEEFDRRYKDLCIDPKEYPISWNGNFELIECEKFCVAVRQPGDAFFEKLYSDGFSQLLDIIPEEDVGNLEEYIENHMANYKCF